MNSELERKAADIAINAHGEQKRKYTGLPYWTHCREVADIVRTVSSDPVVHAVAWLHDTLEDTDLDPVVISQLHPMVYLGVKALTDSEKALGNRATRKRLDRERIALAPPNIKSVKLADLISNTRSIAEHDPNFAVVYMREKHLLISESLEDGNPELLSMAKGLLWNYHAGRLVIS